MFYDLAELKEKDLGPIEGYEISADGKKMLVSKDGAFGIVDLPKGPVALESKLDLSGMEVALDLRQEWDQIYEESGRQMKQFFYAPNMHGVDWEALRLRYKPLAAAVRHRADLTYVIGELIGELSTGHTYVGGGEMPAAKRVKVGMLGAKLERDAKTGSYRIARILKGQSWDPALRSPLAGIGVDVREGEYIVAVDGRPLAKTADIYETLYNTVGKQVTLKIAAGPDGKGARDVVVVPIETENALYYNDWVEGNIAKVDKAIGRQGRLHPHPEHGGRRA